MTTDPSRTPVLIGAAAHTSRITDPSAAPDALDILTMVARDAGVDAVGEPGLTPRLTHVWTVNSLSLGGTDPTGAVRERLGVTDADVRYSTVGGSVPQVLVNRAAELILSGHRPVVLIVGSEALAAQKRIARSGVLEGRVQLPPLEERPNLWPPMDVDPGTHPVEMRHGLGLPVLVYAMIETALAHAMGHDPLTHRRYMARLMDRLNEVAAHNPLSWFPTRRTAEELATPGGENRWISFPYTKHLCSVMDVDMGAAVVVTDALTARELGLGPDEVVYVRGGGEGRDIWIVAERPSLADSPGIAAASRRALSMAGLDLSDVTAFDLYSAFPSSVEMAMRAIEIHIDDPRPLTLTGGLPYHGGPGNNYVGHAIAAAFHHVREQQHATVLVEGSGYFITKHGVGLYSTEPPETLFEPTFSVQQEVEASAAPVSVDERAGDSGRIVAYTAPFDRSGALTPAIVLVELGAMRNIGLGDPELTEAVLQRDLVGAPVRLALGETTNSVRLAVG